jgi:competence protein ComEC
MATALVWARKEGLDAGTRDAFARAGVAHLLAISGFHVGVVAGLLLLGFGFFGLPHPVRFLLAAAGVWLYVLAIGAPDAALRAALLFSALALGRWMNRAVAPLGAMASVFTIFLVLDPGAWIRPGFQLSFAGTLGLVLGYGPLRLWLVGRAQGRAPGFLVKGLAAGAAATLATLPLVAWHFGRVSLVGIPVTLLAAPLVALAIPGILASLLASLAHPMLGVLLAHGVEAVLQTFTAVVGVAARLPFASVWVSRPTVLAVTLALVLAWLALQIRPKLRKVRRPLFLSWAVATGVLAGPLATHLMTRGQLELVILDVGQGDALLLRSPGGQWVLVDAGPGGERFDAGARTILPYLRQRGARRLDLLVLTHPDMDHVGGAPAILRDFPVRAVADPGAAVGKGPFLDVLMSARAVGVPWRVLRSGDSLSVDGVALRVVAPEPDREGSWTEDANAASIVLELRFGGFAALLTGDAPDSAERRFLSRLLSPRFQVLKVGHHGSSTSTSQELLERADPEVALISVGRRNRFGHPAPGVLGRLSALGIRILRTDTHGTLVVKARPDGSYRLWTSVPSADGPRNR